MQSGRSFSAASSIAQEVNIHQSPRLLLTLANSVSFIHPGFASMAAPLKEHENHSHDNCERNEQAANERDPLNDTARPSWCAEQKCGSKDQRRKAQRGGAMDKRKEPGGPRDRSRIRSRIKPNQIVRTSDFADQGSSANCKTYRCKCEPVRGNETHTERSQRPADFDRPCVPLSRSRSKVPNNRSH
jgi:hypothetical protein